MGGGSSKIIKKYAQQIYFAHCIGFRCWPLASEIPKASFMTSWKLKGLIGWIKWNQHMKKWIKKPSMYLTGYIHFHISLLTQQHIPYKKMQMQDGNAKPVYYIFSYYSDIKLALFIDYSHFRRNWFLAPIKMHCAT